MKKFAHALSSDSDYCYMLEIIFRNVTLFKKVCKCHVLFNFSNYSPLSVLRSDHLKTRPRLILTYSVQFSALNTKAKTVLPEKIYSSSYRGTKFEYFRKSRFLYAFKKVLLTFAVFNPH